MLHVKRRPGPVLAGSVRERPGEDILLSFYLLNEMSTLEVIQTRDTYIVTMFYRLREIVSTNYFPT